MAVFSVVKFDGITNSRWVVYKFPGNEFNAKSKLIVGIGQVAVVVRGGKVENIFESGTYILDSLNLPFLKNAVKSLHGGKTPFTLDIYYINKTIKLDMLWGTKDPIQLIDPKYNIKIRVRARGQFGIKILNYQFFLTNLVGTISNNTFISFDKIQEYFRGLINTKIKSTLGEYVLKNNISVLDMSMYIEEIAKSCEKVLDEEMEKFGLDVVNFYIESINSPEEDLSTLNNILNKKAEMEIMGDSRYQTVRGFDVLEKAASNEGAGGGLVSSGVGLGLGLGAAKSVNEMMSGTMNNSKKQNCRNCGHEIGDAKFCPNCGTSVKIKCSTCEAELKPNAKFCSECGTKIG